VEAAEQGGKRHGAIRSPDGIQHEPAVQSAAFCWNGFCPAAAASAAGEYRHARTGLNLAVARGVDPLAVEGLPAALRRLAAERLAHGGLAVTVELYSLPGEDTLGLSEAKTTGLYRIAQEALTNVAKHAATQQAIVRLNLTHAASFLEIEDGGIGFDPQGVSSKRGHLGLAGLAERAQELGWCLSIESHPGRGTRIRVTENPPGGAQ
jgi:signal transduction histidine kinase